MVVRYAVPRDWLRFDRGAIQEELVAAKAAVLALAEMPYQRSWADELQVLQLKREVAGTSRIEGAEFTEKELDAAMRDSPEELETRSQRQAAAAVATYRWVGAVPADRPVDQELIREVHRRLVTGCDEDHCAPGQLRRRDENVTFGAPRHRGAEGGEEVAEAFRLLVEAVRTRFPEAEPLLQALALHYHTAAIHPFLDGNGRTARALEALMLQRAGLRDTLFIAMSNYYYENKAAYLTALNDSRERDHDLTPFLKFALRGIAVQCRRLLAEVRQQVAKALYRDTMAGLFGRSASPRKRMMSARHIQILSLLLDEGEMSVPEISKRTRHLFTVKNPMKALLRDLSYLLELGCVRGRPLREAQRVMLSVNIDWPMQITEAAFFERVKEMPKGRLHPLLSSE